MPINTSFILQLKANICNRHTGLAWNTVNTIMCWLQFSSHCFASLVSSLMTFLTWLLLLVALVLLFCFSKGFLHSDHNREVLPASSTNPLIPRDRDTHTFHSDACRWSKDLPPAEESGSAAGGHLQSFSSQLPWKAAASRIMCL